MMGRRIEEAELRAKSEAEAQLRILTAFVARFLGDKFAEKNPIQKMSAFQCMIPATPPCIDPDRSCEATPLVKLWQAGDPHPGKGYWWRRLWRNHER